jgi:hypothetical protein
MAVNDEVGKTGAVTCVKELGGRCDSEEDVCAAHGVRPSSARPMATGSDRHSLVSSDAKAIDRIFGHIAGAGSDPKKVRAPDKASHIIAVLTQRRQTTVYQL